MDDIDDAIAERPQTLQRFKVLGRSAWGALADWLTPPKCLSCRAGVAAGASLCVTCWQGLVFLDDPVCDALGTPFEYDQGEGALSAAAIADPPPWDRARAAVAFNDASRALIHQLKYQDIQEAGIAMARMMARAGRRLIADADFILPVPLHRARLWQRRFNQSAYLAQALARQVAKPVHMQLLLRLRKTRQQVGLTAEERRKNVRRAFSVVPDLQPLIEGKSVLLVDDVRTTGATVAACSRTLQDAGAARVDVLTFALVLEPARLHIEV